MEDAIPQGLPSGGLQTGHEQTTIDPRILFISAGVLVATVVVCQVVLGLWMRDFEHKEERVERAVSGPAGRSTSISSRSPGCSSTPTIDLVEIDAGGAGPHHVVRLG